MQISLRSVFAIVSFAAVNAAIARVDSLLLAASLPLTFMLWCAALWGVRSERFAHFVAWCVILLVVLGLLLLLLILFTWPLELSE